MVMAIFQSPSPHMPHRQHQPAAAHSKVCPPRGRFYMRELTRGYIVLLGLVFLGGVGRATDSRPPADRVDRLVRELGSGSFVARERATRELTDLGIVARDALTAAARDP